MPDDQASASELRRRYQAGGDKDDQLSASQLRARHGVQNGTAGGGGDGGMNPVLIIGAIAVVVAIVVIGMKMSEVVIGQKRTLRLSTGRKSADENA